MMAMLCYAALALMILTVLSNRFWRRQLVAARAALHRLKKSAEDVRQELSEAGLDFAAVKRNRASMEQRVQMAEQELVALAAELESKRNAQTERYYVFDRDAPRRGRFFEARVRYHPNAVLTERIVHRAWNGVRRYLVVAESERSAREQLGERFPGKHGFTVVDVIPCRLAGLSVSHVAELSTFRRPSAQDEDAKRPSRRRVAEPH